MATTYLKSIHLGGRNAGTAISRIIGYVKNPAKTDFGRFISSYECDSRIADEEFLLSKRQYEHITGRDQKRRNVLAYHIRQSFKPGEITPEEANKIGYELAMSFTKGAHAFVVCTHIDKHHIHNHIIFNSTSLDCERKFKDFKRSALAVRRVSDLLCAEHGLSVIENPGPSRGSYGDWLGDKKPPSHKEILKRKIDEMLPSCASFDSFLSALKTSGFMVNPYRKHVTVKAAGWGKPLRLDTLGGDYTEAAIRERLAGTRIVGAGGGAGRISTEEPPAPVSEKPFSLLIDIQEKMRQGKGAGYANWARSFNLKEASKTLLFLRDQGITDYADLECKAGATSKDFHALTAKIRAAETRMAEITALQKQIANYHRTREIYAQYRAAGYNKKFLAAHDAEITIHQGAKKFFDALNLKKLPSIAALKQEYAALLAEKKKLYPSYYAAKETMRQLISAKANVDMVLTDPSAAVLRDQSR